MKQIMAILILAITDENKINDLINRLLLQKTFPYEFLIKIYYREYEDVFIIHGNSLEYQVKVSPSGILEITKVHHTIERLTIFEETDEICPNCFELLDECTCDDTEEEEVSD